MVARTTHKRDMDVLQIVDNDTDLSYVYSAYMDDRKARDIEPAWLPVVRVFAWFSRQENVTGQWRCVFWNEHFNESLESVVLAFTDLNKFDPASR